MTSRALATLALTTFNHERFVSHALESALQQDYSPLEIVVSDDASSDGTAEIIRQRLQTYRGPHAIKFNRNERNLGVGAHTDKVAAMANGEMILLAAGDDIDLPDRVSRVMAEVAASGGRVMAVSAPTILIDADGKRLDDTPPIEVLSDLSLRNFVVAGSPFVGPAAYAARLFREFEPIGADVTAGEDLVLPLRAALLGELRVLPEPLSYYRQHHASLMGGASGRALSATDFRRNLRRFSNGIAAARRVQLRDFRAIAALRANIDPNHELEAILAKRAGREATVARMASGNPLAGFALFGHVLSGGLSLKSFFKTIAMTTAPTVWYRHINRR